MTSGRGNRDENRQTNSGAANQANAAGQGATGSAAVAATTTSVNGLHDREDADSLRGENIHDDLDEESTATTEHIRKFVFTSGIGGTGAPHHHHTQSNHTLTSTGAEPEERLEIRIPELLQGGYSFYTWPSAPVLAWFLWERRHALAGKRILELGAGTALPGILAAKCGARVVLSDSVTLLKSLAHIRKSCLTNNLIPGEDIEVIGLSWGLLLNSVFNLGPLDLIIGADCFYDPSVFEDIIVTVAFLLERNPDAKFLCTYQERSADWCIEALLNKWQLCAVHVNIDEIGKTAGVDVLDLMGGHTIHLIEITREQQQQQH